MKENKLGRDLGFPSQHLTMRCFILDGHPERLGRSPLQTALTKTVYQIEMKTKLESNKWVKIINEKKKKKQTILCIKINITIIFETTSHSLSSHYTKAIYIDSSSIML